MVAAVAFGGSEAPVGALGVAVDLAQLLAHVGALGPAAARAVRVAGWTLGHLAFVDENRAILWVEDLFPDDFVAQVAEVAVVVGADAAREDLAQVGQLQSFEPILDENHGKLATLVG